MSLLSSNTINLGLIGKRLSHSFSKLYFDQKFDRMGIPGHYQLYELSDVNQIVKLIDDNRLDGFNVTIPYKEAIIPLLDDIDSTANEIGAVNTVAVYRTNGDNYRLKGFNTDATAFADTLKRHLQPYHQSALILGTGGAAKAVAWALKKMGIDHCFVSRQPHGDNQIDYEEAFQRVSKSLLIVNCTPVGMFPNVDTSPWAHPELLTPKHLVYDLIYNPYPTLFMRQASLMGAKTANGLAMLHRQADQAFQIWSQL